jgi:hypothetical protein
MRILKLAIFLALCVPVLFIFCVCGLMGLLFGGWLSSSDGNRLAEWAIDKASAFFTWGTGIK